MRPQNTRMIVNRRISSSQQTRVTKGRKVLRRIKTKRSSIPQSPSRNAIKTRPKRLRSILNQLEPIHRHKRRKSIKISALPIKMDRHHSSDISMLLSHFRHSNRADIERFLINISQQRRSPNPKNTADSGKKTEGSSDDIIARPNVERSQRKPESVSPAGAANSIRNFAGSSRRVFKLHDFRAEDEALRGTNSLNGGHDFVANKSEFTGQIEQRDGLERLLRHQRLSYRDRRRRGRSMLYRSECDERRWTPV